MKIIRPEYTPPKAEEKPTTEKISEVQKEEKKQLLDEMTAISQECGLYDDNQLIDDNTNSIEHLMQSVINNGITENTIKVEFTLTKRQYELWQKKGEVAWLKKALVGARLKKSRK